MIKVLLVGTRLYVEALASVLDAQDDLQIVGVLSDPFLVAPDVCDTQPDVTVMDQSADWIDIPNLIATLRRAHAGTRVVVLGDSLDRNLLSACVRAGAAGYRTTDCTVADLVRSIRQVHNGEALFEPDTLVDLLTFSAIPRLSQPLAPRELEVLKVLATGLSTGEAAAQLRISIHTVRTHLKKAMTKLRARSKLEAIILAHRDGLIDLPR